MGFDAQNFGLGLLAGWASAYGIYRARNLIAGTVQQVNQGAQRVQYSATRSADSRYINDLIELCETSHLAGKQIKLSEIVVEPRFLPPDILATPPDEEPYPSPYKVVPNIPDHPFLQAPFALETLAIDELAHGNHALALVGQRGSGRTTALMTIALQALGRVKFRATPDGVQQRLDAEERKMAEKERAVRVKERVTMEQRAKDQLATEQGENFEAAGDLRGPKDKQAKPADLPGTQANFNRLMPIYVHLADLGLKTTDSSGTVDPAEPIVRAVQSNVRRVTASTIPRNFYSRLSRGQALLLVDGFDDMAEAERLAALDWLRAFRELYPGNFVIVAAPAVGWAPLAQAGFTAVFLRPWSDLDADSVAKSFKDNWPKINRGRPRKTLNDEIVERAQANNRALSTTEVILKIWAGYAEDTDAVGVAGWYRAYLGRMVPKWEDSQNALTQIALLQLDEGFISAGRLQAMGALTSAALDATSGSLLQAGAEAPDEAEAPQADKKDTETASAQGRLLGVLRRAGLLIRFRGDRYRFRSSMLASYLASIAVRSASLDALKERLDQPDWNAALAYAALARPMDDLASFLLKAQPDLLMETQIKMARWLAYAPADAKWRGVVLNGLGVQFIAPSQYPTLRERVAAALVESRDKNVLLVFRRAVRNMDADIRRLACLAMGALGDPEGLRDLRPLIDDRDPRVQLAAGMALGAVGTDEALQVMAVALTSGSEPMRQAMAEAFSALPEQGFPTLFDAIRDDDLMVRRAAVFGLRRIKSTWALIEIYRTFLEDDQWYVRSAAQHAFQENQFGRAVSMTLAYPSAQEIGWLQKWAAARGEALPTGEAGWSMLIRVLQEGDAAGRAMAARAAGQLLRVDMLKPLYNALRDARDDVRSAAFRSLAEIQVVLGQPLPSLL